MKWLPSLTIGAVALFGGMGFGRILGPNPSNPDLMPENPYTVLVVVAVYGTAFMVILGLIAVSLRRLAISARAREWQTERALGGTMRGIVASEARLGLRHGLLVSGPLVLLGAAARQFLPGFDGRAYLSDGHFEPWGVAGIALVGTMCVATTVAVYAVAALTAMSPAAGSDVSAGPERPARARARWGRLLRPAVIVVFGVCTVALVWRRLVPASPRPGGTVQWSSPDYWWATYAAVVFAVGCVVVGVRVVTSVAERLARATGRVLLSRGRGVFLQAGDALTRTTTDRQLALGVMAIVVGLVTWISGAADINVARAHISDDMQPLAIVRPSALVDQIDQQELPRDAGYPTQTLDADVVGALSADDRVVAVPFAYLRTDVQSAQDATATQCSDGVCEEDYRYVDTYAVMTNANLERLAADGLRPLGLSSGVTIQGQQASVTSVWGAPGPTALVVDGTHHPIYRSDLQGPGNFVDAAWAQERFGERPVNGMWLQLSDPGNHTPTERAAAMQRILNEHLRGRADVSPLTFDYGYDGMFSSGLSAGGVATSALGVLLGVALIGALAARSARDRRRDLATMAALGASPRTLRLSPVVEMVATTAAAVVAGSSRASSSRSSPRNHCSSRRARHCRSVIRHGWCGGTPRTSRGPPSAPSPAVP